MTRRLVESVRARLHLATIRRQFCDLCISTLVVHGWRNFPYVSICGILWHSYTLAPLVYSRIDRSLLIRTLLAEPNFSFQSYLEC